MHLKQKRLVVPFIQKPPHANILFRSFGIGRIGLAFLYQCLIVLRNNWKDVSSLNRVFFQSSSLCFWAHSTHFCLWAGVNIGVQRGSAFWYPRLTKCLETVERETSTPISFNLSATDPAEIEGCLQMYCPIAWDAFVVIFLIRPLPPLCFISPVSWIFLRFRRIVLIGGIFVKLCISIAFRIPCLQKCNMACRCVSCFDDVILRFDKI